MKRIDSKLVWQGDSWALRVDMLQLADGTIVRKGVVVHPGSVVLVPIRPLPNHRHEILMLKQYRHVLGQTILELPAGTREGEEAWLLCAQRELQEETGHRAESFTLLGEVWPAPGFTNELMRIYLAQDLQPDPLPGDVDELIEVVPMPLDDLLTMVQDGRIQDAKTIVGLQKTAVYLQQPS